MSTLLLSHPACLNHLTPAGHPERPDRLRAIDQVLEDEKFQSLARVEAPLGSLDVIALCHPMEYVEAIREASPSEGLVRLDADTAMSPGSYEAALRAVDRIKQTVPVWKKEYGPKGAVWQEGVEPSPTPSASANSL